MNALAEVQHIRSVTGLYKQHMPQLMDWLSSSHDRWTCYSPELLQLDVIATQSGETIGSRLGLPLGLVEQVMGRPVLLIC